VAEDFGEDVITPELEDSPAHVPAKGSSADKMARGIARRRRESAQARTMAQASHLAQADAEDQALERVKAAGGKATSGDLALAQLALQRHGSGMTTAELLASGRTGTTDWTPTDTDNDRRHGRRPRG
jgi:hypothetical protein